MLVLTIATVFLFSMLDSAVDTVFCNKRFVFLLFGNNIGMLFYLLKFVKKYIDLGKSLTEAFKDFAQAQGYTAKSVKKSKKESEKSC